MIYGQKTFSLCYYSRTDLVRPGHKSSLQRYFPFLLNLMPQKKHNFYVPPFHQDANSAAHETFCQVSLVRDQQQARL